MIIIGFFACLFEHYMGYCTRRGPWAIRRQSFLQSDLGEDGVGSSDCDRAGVLFDNKVGDLSAFGDEDKAL